MMAMNRLWGGIVLVIASLATVVLTDDGGFLPLGIAVAGFLLILVSFSEEGKTR